MGIGNSREPYGYQPRRRSGSPRFGIPSRRNNRRGYFRRRRPSHTIEPILPPATLPISYPHLYGSYYANKPGPFYGPLQPIASPYLPISYNNYAAPLQIPPQYMMMPQQRVAPSMPMPYMHPPPMSMPYPQQLQMQPVYNNIGVPPPSMPVGTGPYPASYPSAPARLLTDWTGGGKISPGFLGPPI